MPDVMRYFALAALALSIACTSADDDGSDVDVDLDSPDAAVATSSCPSAPPAVGELCADEVGVGTECLYDVCSASGTIASAVCSPIELPAVWQVSTESCTCNEQMCEGDSVCVANVGGALLVDCQPHSCGDGPLTCDCVCGPGVQCDVGDFITGEAQFTCYATCDPDPCA